MKNLFNILPEISGYQDLFGTDNQPLMTFEIFNTLLFF